METSTQDRNARFKERYRTDPEFRRKIIARSCANQKKRREIPEEREKILLHKRNWNNSPEGKAKKAAWYAAKKKDPEWVGARKCYGRAWAKENYERRLPAILSYQKGYHQRKRGTDPAFRLKQGLRNLIGNALRKRGYGKNTKTEAALGCTYQEFVKFVEGNFTQGMTWENYGEWHLDHFTPMRLAASAEQIFSLSHFTNLSPRWGVENIIKSDSILPGPIIKEASWAYDVIWAGKEG